MMAAILVCGLVTVFTSCKTSSEETPSQWSYGVWADVTQSTQTGDGDFLDYATTIKNKIQKVITEKKWSWTVWCTLELAPSVAAVENPVAIMRGEELAVLLKAIKTEVDNKDKSEITQPGSFTYELKVRCYNNLPAGRNGYFHEETIIISFSKD